MNSAIDFITSGYVINVINMICLYLLLTQSLNIIFGLGRLLNLALISTYAIGAYTTAILAVNYNFTVIQTLPFSMLFGAIYAIIIALISLKLKDDDFIIASLAFASLTISILMNWNDLTRGVLGISDIPSIEIFGNKLSSSKIFLPYIFTFTILTLFFINIFFKSKYARALIAISEHPQASSSIGINNLKIKFIGLVFASILSALAGSIYASYYSYIDPFSFSLAEIIFILSIVIIGKPGSFWGVILATIFMAVLPESIRFLKIPQIIDGSMLFVEIPSSYLGHSRKLINAFVLLTVLYFNRTKIFPLTRKI